MKKSHHNEIVNSFSFAIPIATLIVSFGKRLSNYYLPITLGLLAVIVLSLHVYVKYIRCLAQGPQRPTRPPICNVDDVKAPLKRSPFKRGSIFGRLRTSSTESNGTSKKNNKFLTVDSKDSSLDEDSLTPYNGAHGMKEIRRCSLTNLRRTLSKRTDS